METEQSVLLFVIAYDNLVCMNETPDLLLASLPDFEDADASCVTGEITDSELLRRGNELTPKRRGTFHCHFGSRTHTESHSVACLLPDSPSAKAVVIVWRNMWLLNYIWTIILNRAKFVEIR